MELLTPDTAKTKKVQNTAGISSNVLPERGQEKGRYSNKVNEGKKNGKESKDKEINDDIVNCNNRSHEYIIEMDNITLESFGQMLDEKDNVILETKPFIKIELNQLCEDPKDLSYTVSQEATFDANDDTGDLIAKDMLCFAWQIARGMVSL